MPSILLVEDTENISRMYKYGLEREGFTVTAAYRAGEALKIVEKTSFDVIVLDLMLSGMSGLDFLTAYDVKSVSPQTKVVVLTSVDNPSIVARAKTYKIDGYLVKSDYEPAALAQYLRKLLAVPAIPTPHG